MFKITILKNIIKKHNYNIFDSPLKRLPLAALQPRCSRGQRSESMKAKMNFTVPVTLDLTSSPALQPHSSLPQFKSPPHRRRPPPPADAPPPPADAPLPPADAPLPQQTPPCPPPQVGRSSEWDGTSQPKRFLEVVLSRSKSVRAKSSRQEPLSVFQQAPPPPAATGSGSAFSSADALCPTERRL
ncbi:hypothetical protein F7725_001407 [Dissostichus mawsoni]|uniref:Uncharacterized protein n=1 Tax=Dissostichus mawsoni TaxID=36200 RepID=A0A7J5ZH61_DISMA|nr:hypothetical protein F7725_001407 [Dissostichus mawsoni]